VTEQRDDRSPLVLAYEWSARITAISLELVIPVLAGYWLDHRWGTHPWLALVGAGLGFAAATLSLLRLTKPPDTGPPSKPEQGASHRRE
jgi:F0F1-type ATP synthase assembly protein I